jgi:hypothetical protein
MAIRSSSIHLLTVPVFYELAARAFRVAASAIWNTLPLTVYRIKLSLF